MRYLSAANLTKLAACPVLLYHCEGGARALGLYARVIKVIGDDNEVVPS